MNVTVRREDDELRIIAVREERHEEAVLGVWARRRVCGVDLV
jgi:hypothetical protein